MLLQSLPGVDMARGVVGSSFVSSLTRTRCVMILRPFCSSAGCWEGRIRGIKILVFMHLDESCSDLNLERVRGSQKESFFWDPQSLSAILSGGRVETLTQRNRGLSFPLLYIFPGMPLSLPILGQLHHCSLKLLLKITTL